MHAYYFHELSMSEVPNCVVTILFLCSSYVLVSYLIFIVSVLLHLSFIIILFQLIHNTSLIYTYIVSIP